MANDPKSRWARRAAELPTVKADTKEMSLNERLKKVRSPRTVQTEVDGVPRSIWGTTDQIAEKPEPKPKWGAAAIASTVRVGKTVLDSDTLVAKEAYENSRQGLKDQRSRASRLQTMLDTLGDETADAILQGFARKHSADFYSSSFNCQQLVQVFIACFDQEAQGVNGFNIPSLETVYNWMIQQQPSMFEKAPRFRRRGEPAVTPYFYKPEVIEETYDQKTIDYTTMSADERARLKNMDFDELKQKATSQFRTRKPTLQDFRG